MCEFAKEIQRKRNFKIEDYVFGPFDGEEKMWFWYRSKDASEFI